MFKHPSVSLYYTVALLKFSEMDKVISELRSMVPALPTGEGGGGEGGGSSGSKKK